MKRLCCLLFLVACGGGSSQAHSLDWLVGETGVWRTEHSDAVVTQTWQKSGDGYVGKGIVKRGPAVVGGEQHQITHDRGLIVLMITPHGAPASMLTLKEQQEHRLVFVNSDPSAFPTRVVYSLKGQALSVRMEAADGRGVEHVFNATAAE